MGRRRAATTTERHSCIRTQVSHIIAVPHTIARPHRFHISTCRRRPSSKGKV